MSSFFTVCARAVSKPPFRIGSTTTCCSGRKLMMSRRSLNQQCKFSPGLWNPIRARDVAALPAAQAGLSVLRSERAKNPCLIDSNPPQNLHQQREASRPWKPRHIPCLPKIRDACFAGYEFEAVQADSALGSEINTESPQPDVQIAGKRERVLAGTGQTLRWPQTLKTVDKQQIAFDAFDVLPPQPTLLIEESFAASRYRAR